MNQQAAEKAQSERYRQAPNHGNFQVIWDNLAANGGWRMECGCGFITCPSKSLSDVAEEMDDHLETMKA